MKKLLFPFVALVLASCSNECQLKHVSVEPDTIPTKQTETITFRSGDEQSFGYMTASEDTAFTNSVSWHVTLDGKEYRISKRMYQLLEMYYGNNHVRFEFVGRVENDSIVLDYAKQCLRNI